MRHYIEREDGMGERKRFNSFNLAREACKAALFDGKLLKITDPLGDELFPPLGTLPVSVDDLKASDRYLGWWHRRPSDVWEFILHNSIEALGEHVEKRVTAGPLGGCFTFSVKGLRFRLTDGFVTVWKTYGNAYYGYDADIVVET